MTSMAYNSAAGLSGMLKEGHTHLSESTVRNIEAATELSRMVATSLGPNGMNKLVVNHLEKIFVTSDCATIVKELEIEHPAAKMLELAAETQHDECGDATNLTVSFCGELLRLTLDLLRQGLHASEVVAGFQNASDKLRELLPTLVTDTIQDVTDEAELIKVIKPVLGAKQYGSQDLLAPLVAKACLTVMEKSSDSGKPSLQPEAVRVVKILGGDVGKSSLIHGYVALRSVESNVTSVQDAKICVFGCGVEASSTEAKGTVLMKTAEDLKEYNKTEEAKMEDTIKSIADSGVNVVVTGGNVSEMALHFIDRYKLMCLKVGSKWELRRLCQAVGATALVRLGPPTPEEMGHATSVKQQEVGGRFVTVFESDGKLATIVLRASTSSMLQDLERAMDDGVHAVQQACRDGRLVGGAGSVELQLSLQLKQYADTCPGLDQYAIRAFGKALEFVPRTLAENAGLDATSVLADLTAAHASGKVDYGVDITGSSENGTCPCGDILDLLAVKESAFRLAVDAALTVLKVDQIIMSKQSGGGANAAANMGGM